MKVLQLQYLNKSKNQKWLQEEHNRTFIHWLREEISTELEVGNSGVLAAFIIDPRSRKNVLQIAGISFRQFKNWLTTKYIIPQKDEPQLLQVPPEKYSFIEQNHWEEFVRSRLYETFQV
ncbi:hypothetical protein IC582_000770 [Cucumis melo]